MISLGSPHVLRAHMGHTCGEPNEIELPATHRLFYLSCSGPENPAVKGSGPFWTGVHALRYY